VTCGIAASGVDFSLFVSLVGSTLVTFVGFIFPCVLYLSVFWTELREDNRRVVLGLGFGTWKLVGLGMLMLAGVAALIIGTYQAVSGL
jgi:hypothetical protein